MTAAILLTASGESDDNRIHYLAYPGERPIFDATNLPVAAGGEHSDGTPEGAMYTSPIVISAKFLHLKGFDVRNTPMKHNSNSGIFLYASKHIFLNCDAHDNYDPLGWQGDGENADGFGAHYQKPGEGDTTKFIGCRAWWNSDDGFDFINQEFPVVLENCYAMGNGYSDYGLGNPKNGNGYGIKKGSRAIDKGEDLGFPFAGEAPDLGAYEYGMPSSSSVASSSSTASIAIPRAYLAEFSGSALVFDMQGRYLGTLQAEQFRFGSVAEVLRAKFRNPGAYIVRQGNSLQRVIVK